MITFPNCKINLGLHVLHKRDDGYHQLESVFYPLTKCDVLEVVPSTVLHESKVNFLSYGIPVEGPLEQNLVVKAYNLLNDEFDLPPVDVCLLKHIPMGAGLGGGSSDAAHMLKTLNSLFRLNLSPEQLAEYASKLGSDCAFFVHNQISYLHGKGPELSDFDLNLSGYYCVLLAPPIHSSTALAYQHVVARNTDKTTLKELLSQPAANWHDSIINDFEASVFKVFPQLAEIKKQLYNDGAIYASMSGSGSAIFALFDKETFNLHPTIAPLVIHQQWLL
jgi:4-diphosphocytidyl-2-C-methyl-D-erythritol kinase